MVKGIRQLVSKKITINSGDIKFFRRSSNKKKRIEIKKSNKKRERWTKLQIKNYLSFSTSSGKICIKKNNHFLGYQYSRIIDFLKLCK